MTAIAYAVMLDDYAIGAMGPFDSGDIGFLENHLVCWSTLVESYPEVQISLYGCHALVGIAIIGCEEIRLSMNF